MQQINQESRKAKSPRYWPFALLGIGAMIWVTHGCYSNPDIHNKPAVAIAAVLVGLLYGLLGWGAGWPFRRKDVGNAYAVGIGAMVVVFFITVAVAVVLVK